MKTKLQRVILWTSLSLLSISISQLAMSQVTFSKKAILTASSNGIPMGVSAGELIPNNSGPEIVAAFPNLNRIGILVSADNLNYSFNDPMGTTTATNPLSNVALGDINKDGKLDVVVAGGLFSNPSYVNIIYGGGVQPAQAKGFAVGTYPTSVALGDINNDGWLDILTAHRGGGILSVLTAKGDGTFTRSTITCGKGTQDPSWITLGDVDQDGILDMVVLNTELEGYKGLGGGKFVRTSYILPPNNHFIIGAPQHQAFGDLNGDGSLDLAVTSETSTGGYLTALLNNGHGTFGSVKIYPLTGSPDRLAIGDLNGDGKMDVAVANTSVANVSVFLNNYNGGGTFTTSFAPALNFPTNGPPLDVALGDLNGDGRLDMVVSDKDLAVFTNTTLFSQSIPDYSSLNLTYGGTTTLSANASSGLPITYTSSSSGIVEITGNALKAKGTGQVTITAAQAGNTLWAPVTTSVTITVSKADLTIKADNKTRVYNTANPSLTGTTTGLVNSETVKVLYSTEAIKTSNAGTYSVVPYVSPGTANLGNYNLVIQNGTLTINKADQTITFPEFGTITYGTTVPIGASVNTGLSLSYTIEGPAVLSGSNLQINGVGTLKVTATQAGNSNYNITSITRIVTIQKANQTFTHTAIPAVVNYNTKPFDFTYSFSSPTAGSVVFSGPIAYANGKISVTGTGTATIKASHPGDANYNSLTVADITFPVYKVNQTITFATIPNKLAGSAPFAIDASVSSGLPLTYYVNGPASISGNIITLTASTGTVSVIASQPGNANYNAATSVTQTFNILSGGRMVTTTLGTESLEFKEVLVYPNPNNGTFKINNQRSEKDVLVIYNTQGQVLTKVVLEPGLNEIKTDLTGGLYLLKSELINVRMKIDQ